MPAAKIKALWQTLFCEDYIYLIFVNEGVCSKSSDQSRLHLADRQQIYSQLLIKRMNACPAAKQLSESLVRCLSISVN